MAARRFDVTLERVGTTATMFRIPFDLKEAFGRVRVTAELDIEPRTVQIPRDLREALRAGGAEAAFAKFSFTHRREYVDWTEEAERPATRERRIDETVVRVHERRSAR